MGEVGRVIERECGNLRGKMSDQMDSVVEANWMHIQNIPKQVIGYKMKKTLLRARTQVMRRTLQTQVQNHKISLLARPKLLEQAASDLKKNTIVIQIYFYIGADLIENT